jgi:hypothetical protein
MDHTNLIFLWEKEDNSGREKSYQWAGQGNVGMRRSYQCLWIQDPLCIESLLMGLLLDI